MKLTIGWLYPSLMNIYGDRGNLITINKRCEWRGIETEIKYLDAGFDKSELDKCEIILMGGAQDRQQKIVAEDLKKKKDVLNTKINTGTPGLYVCGAYQFLGNYYKEADGAIIKGLGILDLYTQNPGGNSPRLIGNVAASTNLSSKTIIGFENHGGRTYLGKNVSPFAKIIKGFGNNGEDQNEGIVYKNSIGTYLHGPLLPKNPSLADFLIKRAMEIKYPNEVLVNLDDSLEMMANDSIAKRLQIEI